MIVLYPYTQQEDPDTRAFLETVVKKAVPTAYVHEVMCEGPFDYYHALQGVWQSDDILILEHDIVPTEAMLKDMLTCQWPVCAQAYLLYPVSTANAGPFYAHRRFIGTPYVGAEAYRPVQVGEEWAELYGFGFTRIDLRIQDAFPLLSGHRGGPPDLGPVFWKFVDSYVSMRTFKAGFKAHVHWPACDHRHTSRREGDGAI